jgi:hypothetical protein
VPEKIEKEEYCKTGRGVAREPGTSNNYQQTNTKNF